jgi:tetratricopeptide (TPR) repeat protein
MVIALNNLAELYREENKKAEAEKDLEYAMSVMDKALGANDPTKARVLRALAGVKQSLGKDQEAEFLHLQVLKLATDSGKVELKALGLLELASYYHDQKNDEQAEKRYDESLAILNKEVESHNLGMALIAAAECRLTLAKVNTAAADLARARLMIEQLDGKDSEAMAQLLRTEGKCLLAQGKPADAEKVLKQAQAISIKTAGADDLTVGYTLELLGNVYTAEENLSEAEKCYQQAAAIEEKFSTIAPVRCAEGLEAYSKLLDKMQRPDDAGKQAKRAAELRANLFK